MRLPFVMLVAAACACADSGTAPPTWTVQGGFLRDAQGRAVILRGANVSGKNKYAPFFDFHGPADFAVMRDQWGMNAVRFLVMWTAIEPQKGQYDSAYLDAVAQRIAWAQAANLYVVVDMHQDVYGEGFAIGGGDGAPLWSCASSNYAGFKPTNPWAIEDLEPGVTACFDAFWRGGEAQDHFAEAWRRVAERLVGYDNVVGFDVFNEPYWGSYPFEHFEPDALAPFYEKMVPIVRSAAPGWVAFLEPSSLRNLGGTTQLPAPSFDNWVYAPHSYDRTAEATGTFDPTKAPAVRANITSLAAEAKNFGTALWIGEYGSPDTAAGLVQYMTATYDAAGAVAASSMYWDYTKGGYGLLATDGTPSEPLLETVVRPYPERVAGDPVSWTFDGATSTFTLTYHASASVTAPTIVSVPLRVYPQGYVVSCAGCEASAAPGSLVVTTPPAGDPAVLVLRPIPD